MRSTNVSLVLGLVILTLSVFITAVVASPASNQFIDFVEYNPFTDSRSFNPTHSSMLTSSKRWPDHLSKIAPDLVFIQDLVDKMRVEYDLKSTRDLAIADHDPDSKVQTIGPAHFPRVAVPTLMPPPPLPQPGVTTTTTIRKASPTGWSNRYGKSTSRRFLKTYQKYSISILPSMISDTDVRR